MPATITLEHLAKLIRAEIIGGAPDKTLTGVNSLSEATDSEVSFLGNNKYLKQVATSRAGAVIVPMNHAGVPADRQAFLKCNNPNIAFQKAVEFFAPPSVELPPGIHPTAFVDTSATVDPTAYVGPNAVVQAGVSVGKSTIIMGGAYIGHNVKIGRRCVIYPNVTIRERCIIGNKVIIHANSAIGSDGFGFEPGPMGFEKIPQLGIVQIDDDVEIGSCTTIDRARFGRTWIKRGTKIDNLVQVAHNAVIGEMCVLVGQCGVAGSARLGNRVILGAQAGVNGHIEVGEGTQVAGTSSVAKTCPVNSVMLGTPALPKDEFKKRFTIPMQFERLKHRVEELESTLKTFQSELAAVKMP